MSDRVAFLNHIAEHPDADLPRLVFADYLDEQGDPLGEFIRVQIELSHLQGRLGDEETQALLAREDELLVEHAGTWTDNWNMRLVRGLPESVRLNWREFRGPVGSVLARYPTLRAVSLRLPDEANTVTILHTVADSPHLRAVPTLHVESWPDPNWIDTILASPYWNPAVTLRLNLWIDGPAALLESVRLFAGTLARVELVQPFPGPPVGRNPHYIDEAVEELIADLNTEVGREFAHLLRPYERLYPLLGDLGGGFFAGHLKSGALTLFGIAPGGRRVAFCTFTDEGRVDKALWEDTTEPPWTLDRLRERFGFELGFIRVREFEANNQLAVRFWPRAARGIIADGTYDEDPEIAGHLADPLIFAVGFGERVEVRVSFRTGRGAG